MPRQPGCDLSVLLVFRKGACLSPLPFIQCIMAKGICIPQFPLILSVWNMLGSCKESNAVSLLLNIALAASILRVWNFLYIIPVVFISCFIRKMLLGFSVRFHDDIWGVNSNKFLPSYEGLDMALPYPWSPWDFFVFSS